MTSPCKRIENEKWIIENDISVSAVSSVVSFPC